MSKTSLDFRGTNALWGSVLVETLVRSGVRDAVISPGSRSTPVTLALARHEQIEAIPVLDERSAAFFALGLARQHRRPVVLLCTSGSAAANYFPAVIEAQESGVPLIVMTADRPPELRGCASGQTIDQRKIYGGHVNHEHELAVPEASVGMLRYLRQTVAQMCERSLRPQAGPVHLNVPFRDPLAPVADRAVAALESQLGPEFFAHLEDFTRTEFGQSCVWQRALSARGLIIAGPEIPTDVTTYVEKVRALSCEMGWPVLADGVSPLRHHFTGDVAVISTYDTILRNVGAARDLLPRYVLCLGSWPTSKVLRQWLEQSGAELVLVTERGDNRDCLHGRTRHLRVPVESLVAKILGEPDLSYAAIWQKADAAVTKILHDEPRPMPGVFEGDITRILAKNLPQETPLWVASSMAIRDVEYFWPATNRRTAMYFNRGANGIDGTLSSAMGMAHGNQPSVLLTGDLAMLHDSNGFLLSGRLKGSLTIVLINNNGGGIFEHLPIAGFQPPFEEFFATPQSVDFGKLCAAHGVDHIAVRDAAHLSDLVAELPSAGVRVLEVTTDRKQDAAFRKRLFARAAASLG